MGYRWGLGWLGSTVIDERMSWDWALVVRAMQLLGQLAGFVVTSVSTGCNTLDIHTSRQCILVQQVSQTGRAACTLR